MTWVVLFVKLATTYTRNIIENPYYDVILCARSSTTSMKRPNSWQRWRCRAPCAPACSALSTAPPLSSETGNKHAYAGQTQYFDTSKRPGEDPVLSRALCCTAWKPFCTLPCTPYCFTARTGVTGAACFYCPACTVFPCYRPRRQVCVHFLHIRRFIY
jgi:hypothetical protein